MPPWRQDGKEVFCVGDLYAVEVNAKGATVETGPPQTLFGPVAGGGPGILYDVSADGQRFLVAAPPEHAPEPGITIVQNWIAGLKK